MGAPVGAYIVPGGHSMRVIVQRAAEAEVTVDGASVGQIGPGLVALVGVACGDSERDAEFVADKLAHLRIFGDEQGKMNRSMLDVGGAALVISQFTVYADCRKGRRPSFNDAAPPDVAEPLVACLTNCLERLGVPVARGQFGAHMVLRLVNDGPVTVIVDTPQREIPRSELPVSRVSSERAHRRQFGSRN